MNASALRYSAGMSAAGNRQLTETPGEELAGELVNIVPQRSVASDDQIGAGDFAHRRNAVRHILARDQSADHQDRRGRLREGRTVPLGGAGAKAS